MNYKGQLSRLVKHIRSTKRALKCATRNEEAGYTDNSAELKAHLRELAMKYNTLSRSVRYRPLPKGRYAF